MHAPCGCADLAKFSPRERQIITALIAAKQVSEIALALHLTPNTVKAYIKGIYFKAEVHSARELMVKFLSADRPAEERLDSLNRTLAATDIVQVHAAAVAMLQAWTGARRALSWEVPGDDVGGLANPYGAKPLGYGPATAWADGPVLMPAGEAARDPFLRAASAGCPLQGEVCLVLLRLLTRKWLVALANPATGSFAPETLKLARALACIAEHHAESFRPKAVAAVAAGSARRRVG
ncbi:MAG: LuxR C-terminal-related transcriptional regulator [Terriglobales bacterium]